MFKAQRLDGLHNGLPKGIAVDAAKIVGVAAELAREIRRGVSRRTEVKTQTSPGRRGEKFATRGVARGHGRRGRARRLAENEREKAVADRLVVGDALLGKKRIPEADENTPAPGAQTDDWRIDSSRVLDGAFLVRSPMPQTWNWPLASPVRLTIRDSNGAPLELVPYGCAKLRVSMFPDDAGETTSP